ncbi:3-hydroxyacyl-CoA dehydrogenase [Candidatus Anaplasma sp. TIGMIC]|uniref:3-hydroxyacyl-CoA dehydrogenase n=1 Tax=Candidatus Anaplasma sp. TIGMIC TaxID=3020713 RepID=UPI00232F67C6|nr:3-hydroxyacyl-CoA dehydrogenase [Candidatus Anaplasma sp. TIGMIC]MDB1135152.1 3-hydroxyacyl-CoA dehydrogenase [Candidatus Anaplasma sp. TIGMIC]
MDPELSNDLVVKRLVDSGIQVVVYCGEGVTTSLQDGVEMRKFHCEDLDIHDVGCIFECISGDVKAKSEFYNRRSVVNSDVLLLSLGMPVRTCDSVRGMVPSRLFERLIPACAPTFYHSGFILECVLRNESVRGHFDALKECYAGKLNFLVHSHGEISLFDRIGYFLATCSILSAFDIGIGVEVADHIIANEHTGIRMPGFFSAIDQMGVDRFVEGLVKLTGLLEEDDPLQEMCRQLPPVIDGMISDGMTGISGRGGFYRTYSMRYGTTDQVIDLRSGLYRALKRDMFLQECLLDKRCGIFSDAVWSKFFAYVGFLVQKSGEEVLPEVDNILQTGYRWQYGVKELAGRLGVSCTW